MRRTAAGFTLIEVAIAITLLGVLMLGTLSANGRLVESVARERLRTQAAEAAGAQIALVRLWPSYGSLDSAFAGTAANVPFTGWSRTTTVTRIGGTGQANDFKRVTVTVTAPGVNPPVARSVTIAAP